MSEATNRQQASSTRTSSVGNRQWLCWQGWRIEVPRKWNPVKLEGNFEEGFVLLADLQRPRLGLRWTSGRRISKDPCAWSQKMMRDEVGQLASGEAVNWAADASWKAGRLYIEPNPPGRDVWLGYSPVSGRAIEVIHHAHRRERVLAEVLLPTLSDLADENPRLWSVLDLQCRVPSDLKLEKPLLYAGDLGLRFAGDARQQLMIRQIAPAAVALKRIPLDRWLRKQQLAQSKHYRPGKVQEAITLETSDGRELTGLAGELKRRRRFFWKPGLLKQMRTLVMHDVERDRLVIVEGGGSVDLQMAARQVGAPC